MDVEPAAIDLHEADAGFDEPPGHQGAAAEFVLAVALDRLLYFTTIHVCNDFLAATRG